MDYRKAEELLHKQLEVLLRKGQDYGTANISAVGPLGVVVRLQEKITRLHHLLSSGRRPSNEGMQEAWADLVNYALIGALIEAGAWQHSAFMVYLAGPIDDVSSEQAGGWRRNLAEMLAEHNVASFNPVAAYYGAVAPDARIAPAVSSVNRAAIQVCSHLVAYLAGEGRGFGTIREIEYARALGKPVVVIGRLASLEAHDVVQVPDLYAAVRAVLGPRPPQEQTYEEAAKL